MYRSIFLLESFTVINKRTRCVSKGKFSDANAALFLQQQLRMALEFTDAKFRDDGDERIREKYEARWKELFRELYPIVSAGSYRSGGN